MPLARGTAAVGYITLLGLFLASGMRITADIPEGMQVCYDIFIFNDVLYSCHKMVGKAMMKT